jgi:hypothetical protein
LLSSIVCLCQQAPAETHNVKYSGERVQQSQQQKPLRLTAAGNPHALASAYQVKFGALGWLRV